MQVVFFQLQSLGVNAYNFWQIDSQLRFSNFLDVSRIPRSDCYLFHIYINRYLCYQFAVFIPFFLTNAFNLVTLIEEYSLPGLLEAMTNPDPHARS